MSQNTPKNDNTLTAYVFLGGATFTALFILIQSKDIIKNYDFTIFIVAIASILFILAVVGRLNISNGIIKSGTTYSRIIGIFALAGLFLILLTLVLLIVEINIVLGVIIGICAITLFIILDITARKS